MNILKLKGKMAEQDVTIKDLAIQTGISYGTLIRRMSERDGWKSFSVNEIERIIEFLKIPPSDVGEIFFGKKSQKCEQAAV